MKRICLINNIVFLAFAFHRCVISTKRSYAFGGPSLVRVKPLPVPVRKKHHPQAAHVLLHLPGMLWFVRSLLDSLLLNPAKTVISTDQTEPPTTVVTPHGWNINGFSKDEKNYGWNFNHMVGLQTHGAKIRTVATIICNQHAKRLLQKAGCWWRKMPFFYPGRNILTRSSFPLLVSLGDTGHYAFDIWNHKQSMAEQCGK